MLAPLTRTRAYALHCRCTIVRSQKGQIVVQGRLSPNKKSTPEIQHLGYFIRGPTLLLYASHIAQVKTAGKTPSSYIYIYRQLPVRNSIRVDEGRNSWNRIAIKTKARALVGRRGKKSLLGDPGCELRLRGREKKEKENESDRKYQQKGMSTKKKK